MAGADPSGKPSRGISSAGAVQVDEVRCWEEEVVIPTYPLQDADPNPMFLEKRVYQGSSGKVYPNPFTDRVSVEKQDQRYRAIFLENEYVQLMILPAIGGRIHAGLDKTNGYDFFYRQHVIKPALVGLLGPWISGGVEFNWPQHHRPSTFMPVHAMIEKLNDGSCTVWLSEHDPMSRMKGMVGISLGPDCSAVEAKVRLYNRTPLPQTFLWWANVAVRVHDEYQAFFPPDVTFVADHAKRAITSFPLAHDRYYGVDYSPGTDISWYRNIPVPTSYMVTESKYDFFGGYDHARQAGLVHTSNHHAAPGKKLWTWGNAEFGYAWDRNLTDEDGPYVELMAGAYTDNQPDFSWLHPYETKTFSQFWYPIQKIGPAKNANRQVAINLEFADGTVRVGVAVTRPRAVRVILSRNKEPALDMEVSLAPDLPFLKEIEADGTPPEKHKLCVRDDHGNEVITWQPGGDTSRDLPEPATEPVAPEHISSLEELYLTGLHLEQYRHATRRPEVYWLEGLKRDAEDARLNNAMGLLSLRRGEFVEAEAHFARVVRRLTARNPNPYDGEPFYNLGLAQMYQGKSAEAYEAFHKSIWNSTWCSAGNYALACISAGRGELETALEQVDASLRTNPDHLKAWGLKAALLRRLGRAQEARWVIENSQKLDPLDFRMLVERYLLSTRKEDRDALLRVLDGDVQTLLDLAFDLAWSGLAEDALILLRECKAEEQFQYPMVGYTLAWLAAGLDSGTQMAAYVQRCLATAEKVSPRYCFPARLEEMIVLKEAIARNPTGARAHYYLGNLLYDKRRYEEAITCWRRAAQLDESFSIPWRNLGIAEFNVLHDAHAADRMYAKAFAANGEDARLLYEWDQLKKRAGLSAPEERLRWLENFPALVAHRDDLTVEFVTLLNQLRRPEEALAMLQGRRFSPWEGGEGLASGQYVIAQRMLGLSELQTGRPQEALARFDAARVYPHNLGEGKHLLTLERDLDVLAGMAAERMGDLERAQEHWTDAAAPLTEPGWQSYFQACGLVRLGKSLEARKTFSELGQYAERKRNAPATIDYFATSLPNLLLFDDDLEKRKQTECQMLTALVRAGMGEKEMAIRDLAAVAATDPTNQTAQFLLDWMRREDLSGIPEPEVWPAP